MYFTKYLPIPLMQHSLTSVCNSFITFTIILLFKAIALTLDKKMVRRYLCDNNSNPMWTAGMCHTGLVDTLLDWISPELVAKQVCLNDTSVVITNNKRISRNQK